MKHFFDVGANVGSTFTDFLCHDPKYDGWTVWCFEPSPRHLPKLMKTAEQFRHRYQINICPFGIWSEDGMLAFYQKDDPRGDSFFEELSTDHVVNNLDLGYRLWAPVKGIQWILNQIPRSHFITAKLDCEGAEYPILQKLRGIPELCQVSELYVEFHNITVPHIGAQELIDAYAPIVPIKPWTL